MKPSKENIYELRLLTNASIWSCKEALKYCDSIEEAICYIRHYYDAVNIQRRIGESYHDARMRYVRSFL